MAMKEKGRKEGKVTHLAFKPAEDGGLISETHKEWARGGSGGGPGFDTDMETRIHPTIEHAAKHLKNVFKEHMPGNSDNEAEKEPDEGAE